MNAGASVAPPARLLLIEDDASLRRFVALALEDMPVDLQMVGSVDDGIAALRSGAFDLIISDLMLPGRSGFDLIQALEAEPALQASARLVIFSAGLRADTRGKLRSPVIWRLLSKPCGLADLQRCVREGLSHAEEPAAVAAPAPAATAEQDAIERFFGGRAALFEAFRQGCLAQFEIDAALGDAACASGDLAGLRHLAHSLKSVLLTLGHEPASGLARRLEDACAAGDGPQARSLWSLLRQSLPSPR